MRKNRTSSVPPKRLPTAAALDDPAERARLWHWLIDTNSRLEQRAKQDPLTGAFNRRGLERALLAELGREAGSTALLLDLDGFAQINAAYGQSVGDLVLREVVERLHCELEPPAVLGRIDGDELMVVLPAIALPKAAELAHHLRRAISSTPVLNDPADVRVTATAAVVPIDPASTSLAETLAHARLVLRDAKRAGGDRVGGAGAGATEIESGAERATLRQILLGGRGLRVASQPIVRLSDRAHIGQELLVRGPDGLESPARLFGLAREENVLIGLDLVCLRACVDAATVGRLEGDVHANILPATLLDVPPERLLSLLAGCRRLCLELSEQQFLPDRGALRERADVLRRHGIRIGIDDIGAQRGTLDTAVRLSPHVIKIDKALVQALPGPDEDVIARYVRVAEALGADCVAEGIETTAQRDALVRVGVRLGQGYLFGRPEVIGRRKVSGQLPVVGAASDVERSRIG